MKVLRRTINRFTADKDLAKVFVAETLGRYDGKYVNKNDDWGGRYRNTAVGWRSRNETNDTSVLNKTDILLKLNKKRKFFDSIVKNDTFNILKAWAKGSLENQPHLWANDGSLWKNISRPTIKNHNVSIHALHTKNMSGSNTSNSNVMSFKDVENNKNVK